MQTHRLIPHPAHPPAAVQGITAHVLAHGRDWLLLRWRLEGSEQLIIPSLAGKGRADGLWRTTCFEVFLRPEGNSAYIELNLSPSERWAAYDFAGYREEMAERPMPREPDCTMRKGRQIAIFDAAIPQRGLPDSRCAMGICAVIEEVGGALSYWGLAHSRERPDFHDPACFAAKLPAAQDA